MNRNVYVVSGLLAIELVHVVHPSNDADSHCHAAEYLPDEQIADDGYMTSLSLDDLDR